MKSSHFSVNNCANINIKKKTTLLSFKDSIHSYLFQQLDIYSPPLNSLNVQQQGTKAWDHKCLKSTRMAYGNKFQLRNSSLNSSNSVIFHAKKQLITKMYTFFLSFKTYLQAFSYSTPPHPNATYSKVLYLSPPIFFSSLSFCQLPPYLFLVIFLPPPPWLLAFHKIELPPLFDTRQRYLNTQQLTPLNLRMNVFSNLDDITKLYLRPHF